MRDMAAKKAAADPSGRLLVRLPPALHRLVQTVARAAGLSVNEYCMRMLAAPGPTLALNGPWLDVLTRAHGLFGAKLAGLVAHGSWARGEISAASDIDVLIVVARSTPLVRATYRSWDETPLSWDGRSVDAHVVHLPDSGTTLSALWYEAAIEGAVLFERNGALSAQLLRARQAIAGGAVVRRVVQGQPYWTEAA